MSRPALDLAPPPELSPADKLRLALEMADLGIEMKRRTLRREHPDDNGAQITARLHAWLAAPR